MEGDIIHIPTGIFRAFENIGTDYALVLGRNGKSYDSKRGHPLPDGVDPMPLLSDADLKAFAEPTTHNVVPHYVLCYNGLYAMADRKPVVVIGQKGMLCEKPGFEMALMTRACAPDDIHRHVPSSVLMSMRGHWRVNWEGGNATLAPGDTMSVPENLAHNAVPLMTCEPSLYNVVTTGDATGVTWQGWRLFLFSR